MFLFAYSKKMLYLCSDFVQIASSLEYLKARKL